MRTIRIGLAVERQRFVESHASRIRKLRTIADYEFLGVGLVPFHRALLALDANRVVRKDMQTEHIRLDERSLESLARQTFQMVAVRPFASLVAGLFCPNRFLTLDFSGYFCLLRLKIL